jgi:uncharacterized membrane protein YhaH (DUF805 family)
MENLTTTLNECIERFSETEEYRMMQGYRTRDNRFTFDERLAIAKSVERTFAPIFELMKADVPTLKDSDLLFCALSIQHFETIAIAECLTVTPEAVRMRKFRIREKLPSKWMDILYPEMKRNSNADVTSQTSAEPKAEISLPSQITKNVKVMKEKMSFGKAVSTCFSKYFTINGRARRSEYWYFCLFCLIVSILFAMLKSIIESIYPFMGESMVCVFRIFLETFYWVLNIAILIPSFTVSVRRLHDIDASGWLAVILCLIPTIIAFAFDAAMKMSGFYTTMDNLGNMPPSELSELANTLKTMIKPLVAFLFFEIGVLIASVIVFCLRGTEGPNTYGPDPIRVISTDGEESK